MQEKEWMEEFFLSLELILFSDFTRSLRKTGAQNNSEVHLIYISLEFTA